MAEEGQGAVEIHVLELDEHFSALIPLFISISQSFYPCGIFM